MKYSLNTIVSEIRSKEEKLSSQTPQLIDEAYQMTLYLQDLLHSVKNTVVKQGFKNEADEINFFRNVKPQILGKLIYYNKVFRIESSCPVNNGEMYITIIFRISWESYNRNIANIYVIRIFTDITDLAERTETKLISNLGK